MFSIGRLGYPPPPSSKLAKNTRLERNSYTTGDRVKYGYPRTNDYEWCLTIKAVRPPRRPPLPFISTSTSAINTDNYSDPSLAARSNENSSRIVGNAAALPGFHPQPLCLDTLDFAYNFSDPPRLYYQH